MVGFTFTSCEKCETCTVTVKDWAWDDGLTQAEIDALEDAGMGQAYYDALFEGAYGAGEEYCDDDLDAIKDESDIVIPGAYTVGWECIE